MYTRLQKGSEASFFLFGPRGTGKSAWVLRTFPRALYLDLLDPALQIELLAAPERLGQKIDSGFRGRVIVDEVQKVPALLDEVHRLIERRGLRFVLTGSSARKLRRSGVNLLAGRARTRYMHPLTARELGRDFRLSHSLRYGQLPAVYVEKDPESFLASYVQTYLREEVLQEGLTRNLGAFSRFLEVASLSQAAPLNVSALARDASVDRKVAENYVSILEDLLLAVRVPAFTRKAKRRVAQHPKFFFFDAGVYHALRPRGPLDTPSDADGAALETLVLAELRAHVEYAELGYTLHYYRTASGQEVDFVLYGERGLVAIEVKRAPRIRSDDLAGLRTFLEDYPMARAFVVYGGSRAYREGKVTFVPVTKFLEELPDILEV
jgi:predicted AAA+ superfamily ATPase